MFLKYNKWALLWALLIFILCAIPGKDLPRGSWMDMIGIDKFVHAFLFFIQVILLMRGFAAQSRYVAPVLCILYGGMLEVMQGVFYTDRTADLYDFLANSFGVAAGVIFFKPRV